MKKLKLINEVKLLEMNDLFNKLDKNSVEISKLFIFCKDFILNSDDSVLKENVLKLKFDGEIFYLVEKIEQRNYAWHQYLRQLENILKDNRTKMLEIIFSANDKFNLFNIEEEEIYNPLEDKSGTELITF